MIKVLITRGGAEGIEGEIVASIGSGVIIRMDWPLEDDDEVDGPMDYYYSPGDYVIIDSGE